MADDLTKRKDNENKFNAILKPFFDSWTYAMDSLYNANMHFWFIDELRKQNIFPILNQLPPEIVYRAFPYLIYAYKNSGTIEAFLALCYAFFSSQCTVEIIKVAPNMVDIVVGNSQVLYNYTSLSQLDTDNDTVYEPFTKIAKPANINNYATLVSAFFAYTGITPLQFFRQFVANGVIIRNFDLI